MFSNGYSKEDHGAIRTSGHVL